MSVWTLNTRFHLTTETRRFLEDKLQFETTNVKTISFWSRNTGFTLRWKTDGLLMRNSNLKQWM